MARVTVESTESKAIADQIMTGRKERLTERQDALSPRKTRYVDNAKRIQVGLAA
jgi:hypothetical protein